MQGITPPKQTKDLSARSDHSDMLSEKASTPLNVAQDENSQKNLSQTSSPTPSEKLVISTSDPAPAIDPKTEDDDAKYPTGLPLILIFVSICASTFLVAIDGTILATAIPTITSQFNSLEDVSWYNASFLLTTCAFQLAYGRAYTIFRTKWVFLSAIFIFEIGNVISGAAPNSVTLIIGRAIAGIGGGGIFGGCFIIIAESTPLRKRSLFTGFIGGTFGIASVVGPLLGGALTVRVSWRWCFYINLPIGALVLVLIGFILPKSLGQSSLKSETKTWWQQVKRLDPVGTAIFVPSIICLLLALQWGGTQYPWSDAHVIAPFVCFGVSFIAWLVFQYYLGEDATVPFSILKQRSVIGACLFMTLGSGAFTVIVYYLPLWFQAIRGDNAEQSGIHVLPMILSLIVISIASGGAVVVFGYYTPFLIAGSIVMSVGAGLFYTLKPDARTGIWIGYQILFAAGVGMTLEQCNIAIQTVLPKEQIAAGTSLSILVRSLGGTMAVAISQNVFDQKLRKGLAKILPDLDVSLISGSGATTLVANIQAALGDNKEVIQQVLNLYNNAVVQTFLVALVLAVATFPASLLVEWKSVKKEKREEDDKKSGDAEKLPKLKNDNKIQGKEVIKAEDEKFVTPA